MYDHFFLVNIDGKQGAVGFTSVLFPFVYPVRISFKIDLTIDWNDYDFFL